MIEFEIADEADQQFATILNDRRVTMRLRYSSFSDRWSLDLSLDDEPVIMGVRVVTGADILQPYQLGIGLLFCTPTVGDSAVPGRKELPDGVVKLYHATELEIEASLS